MKMLGIYGVADAVVGDGMLRGVSGGQKRRVTGDWIFSTYYPSIGDWFTIRQWEKCLSRLAG